MKKKQPLVCIVILNWNGGETTLNCLKSLRKTSYKNYKVIILDNGSSDKSPDKIAKKFKEIDLVRLDENIGYTAGINYSWNYCLKKYDPKYVVNMNNDIITVQKDWLDLMVKELEKDKLRGICGNKLVFPDGRLQLLYLDRKPEDYLEKDKGQYDFVKEVSAVGGANLLIKVDVIKKVGGTDENYFYGPDDIDYCLRARKAGFKIVYNGLSKSEHIGSFSYLSSSKDFIYKHQSYGQMVFWFRHHGFLNGIKMSLRQLSRAFFTRKDPFKKISTKNIYFHRSFLKRIGMFIISFILAIKNYRRVMVGDYPELK